MHNVDAGDAYVDDDTDKVPKKVKTVTKKTKPTTKKRQRSCRY